jgi:hypothetical protein
MRRALLLLAACLYLVACSQSVEEKEIVGKFVAEYSYAREELELKADGSYAQRIALKGQRGGEVIHTGTWKYQKATENLWLQDPLLVDDNFGNLNPNYKKPTKGVWGLYAKRGLGGGITLNWNDDLGVSFKRV